MQPNKFYLPLLECGIFPLLVNGSAVLSSRYSGSSAIYVPYSRQWRIHHWIRWITCVVTEFSARFVAILGELHFLSRNSVTFLSLILVLLLFCTEFELFSTDMITEKNHIIHHHKIASSPSPILVISMILHWFWWGNNIQDLESLKVGFALIVLDFCLLDPHFLQMKWHLYKNVLLPYAISGVLRDVQVMKMWKLMPMSPSSGQALSLNLASNSVRIYLGNVKKQQAFLFAQRRFLLCYWLWCLWEKVKSENLVFLKLVICQDEHIWKAKALGNLFGLQFWRQYKCDNWFPP